MIELPQFCAEWFRYERLPLVEQQRFVADELRRLEREGLPVLTTVLAAMDGMVQQLALDLIKAGVDGNGEPVIAPRVWMLRLRRDAVPPSLDPHGYELPKDKRGKVLVAKVGNIGAHINLALVEGGVNNATSQFSGDARPGMRVRYHTQEIGRTATPVTYDRAVAILRQWGVGVQRNRYAIKSGWKPGTEFGEGQDRWLVEEVVPGHEADDTAKAKGGAAA